MTIYETVDGKSSPAVGNTCNNLALLYHNQGKFAEAEPLYKRAISIFEAESGPNNPQLIRAASNYAELLRSKGRTAEAKIVQQKAASRIAQE